MCLLAKINDREFWAFYLDGGRVELRDENFQTVPLPHGPVMVKDQLEPGDEWKEVSYASLIDLAKNRMSEALSGLKNLSSVCEIK